jgi:Carbohydrate-selective porin, OprB family
MYRLLFKLGKRSSVVLAATVLLAGQSTAAQAQTATDATDADAKTADIRRTDAAYQTLQELQAKYDCVPSNSPILNSKKKVVSRAEFASGVNSCLQSIEELVAKRPRKPVRKKRRSVAPPPELTPEVMPAPAPEPIAPPPAPVLPPAPVEPAIEEEAAIPVTQEDIDRLRSLVNMFGDDLQAMDARIKKASFSTTTKLVGEAIVSFSGYGGVAAVAPTAATPLVAPAGGGALTGGAAATPGRLASNNIFTNRVRLNFDTSFAGKDRLRTRLQSRNTTPFNAAVTGTNMTRLGYDGNDGENDTLLSLFQYDLPLGDQTKLRIATIGYEFNDNQPTLNPLLSSSANGSISRFGRFNPIFRLSGDGAAFNLSQKLGDALSLDLGYAVPATATSTASTVTPSNGFFLGQNAILSQLTYAPSKEFSVAALYGRTYNNAGGLTGGTGSASANSPFGNVGTTANHYSFLATTKLGEGVVLSGWAGFIEANREAPGSGRASVSNYAVTLGFPDFGAEGNALGFVFGIPPKLNSRTTTTAAGVVATAVPDNSTSYHLEAIYKIKLNDNVDITPGLLLITNPEHNSANATEYVGTLRTTFRF